LPKAIAWWSQRSEPDSVIDERQHKARSLRWQVELDGSVVTTVRVPPGQASVLMAAVDAMVMRRAQCPADNDEAWPSLAQQRAVSCLSRTFSASAEARCVSRTVRHSRAPGAHGPTLHSMCWGQCKLWSLDPMMSAIPATSKAPMSTPGLRNSGSSSTSSLKA